MRVSRKAVVVLALAGLGCGNPAKKAIEQRRIPVAQKLAGVTAIAPQVKSLPPAEQAAITLGTTPLVLAFNSTEARPTATIVYQQDLDDLSTFKDDPPHYTMRINRAQLLQSCGQLLERGTYGQQSAPNVHVNVAVDYLEACANLAYVFVLRTRTLEGRTFAGDLLAFELASGKHLGAIPLTVTSQGRRDTVDNTTTTRNTQHVGSHLRTTVTKTTTRTTVDADREQMNSDLDSAVEAGIKAAVPSVRWLN